MELEGRAFFAVVPDDRPFVVRTSIGQVTVEGTRFEVATEGEWPRVVVVEGKVRLDTPGGRVEVRQGQVAYWSAGHAPVVTDHDDVWSVLEWPDGLLVFQATPLSTVADELERHFGLHVQVNDRASGDIRITAWFEDEPFDEVMSAVCLAAGVKCDIHDAGAVIGD